jgi:hypothetical protein
MGAAPANSAGRATGSPTYLFDLNIQPRQEFRQMQRVCVLLVITGTAVYVRMAFAGRVAD